MFMLGSPDSRFAHRLDSVSRAFVSASNLWGCEQQHRWLLPVVSLSCLCWIYASAQCQIGWNILKQKQLNLSHSHLLCCCCRRGCGTSFANPNLQVRVSQRMLEHVLSMSKLTFILCHPSLDCVHRRDPESTMHFVGLFVYRPSSSYVCLVFIACIVRSPNNLG